MSENKDVRWLLLSMLVITLFAVSVISLALALQYSRMQFQLSGNFCGEFLEKLPESKQNILEVLKSNKGYPSPYEGEHILLSLGYQRSDFGVINGWAFGSAGAAFLAGAALFLGVCWHWHNRVTARINALSLSLEKAAAGGQEPLFDMAEDEFSRLWDEIDQSVTTLRQTKENALKEQNNFSDNLSNIAHQLKTLITSISLCLQMMEEHPSGGYSQQIRRQLDRLTHLEEALLLLARIDAGTLPLERNRVDIFTLLTLASDNLRELFLQNQVSIEIPEAGEAGITADLNWTMEAVMNLMKNCMEHSDLGMMIHCSYEQNPLYVQIWIWDEGRSFAAEDLPHLFERFYRGAHHSANEIGIGLALSKAIVEMQNGVIRAFDLPGNGACFWKY